MDVMEFAFAGKTDQTELLAGRQALARPHRDAALAQVAKLALPAAAVVDEDAVATFTTFDPFRIVPPGQMVRQVIPGGCYRARSSGQDGDVTVQPTRIWKSKICALMAIIDKSAARIIPGAGSRVSVNVVLDCTDSTDFTSYRQGQPEFCFRSYSWATRNQKNDDDTRDNRTPQSCCRRS